MVFLIGNVSTGIWSNTLFLNMIFFTFQAFSNSLLLVCLSFHAMLVIPNRLPLFSFPVYFSAVYPLLRGQLFLLTCLFISPLCIKPHVSNNKQFFMDSFLDWEGSQWDICSNLTSHYGLHYLPSVLLLPTHCTRFSFYLQKTTEWWVNGIRLGIWASEVQTPAAPGTLWSRVAKNNK